MRIDDYTAQVMAIVESCKTGAMTADGCLAQLETLNDEQVGESGVTINVTLEQLLEVENIEDASDFGVGSALLEDDDENY